MFLKRFKNFCHVFIYFLTFLKLLFERFFTCMAAAGGWDLRCGGCRRKLRCTVSTSDRRTSDRMTIEWRCTPVRSTCTRPSASSRPSRCAGTRKACRCTATPAKTRPPPRHRPNNPPSTASPPRAEGSHFNTPITLLLTTLSAVWSPLNHICNVDVFTRIISAIVFILRPRLCVYLYLSVRLCLWVSQWVDLSHIQNFTKFSTRYQWPWLGHPLMTVQCVIYFRFCGRRYVFTQRTKCRYKLG